MNSQTLTVEFNVHTSRGRAGQKQLRIGPGPVAAAVPGAVPRAAKLMALAIHFEGLVARGEVRDFADLARCGHVTRARVSQIMNLLNLSPAIQERVLFVAATERGRELVTERDLRQIAGIPCWKLQSAAWDALLEKAQKEGPQR